MVNLSIPGKQRFPAAGILMSTTEQRLGEIETSVSSASIAEINQAGKQQVPVPAILGQHVSLLQVVVAKDGSPTVLQNVEARLRPFFQTAREGLLSAWLAKLPQHLVEC
jgi:hypothetical protein